MDDKGFVRIDLDEYVTTIHYVKINDKFYGLTDKSSNKVNYIENNDKVKIANGMKSEDFFPAFAKIKSDLNLSKEVFNTMSDLEFSHFKEWNNDIIAIEFLPIS